MWLGTPDGRRAGLWPPGRDGLGCWVATTPARPAGDTCSGARSWSCLGSRRRGLRRRGPRRRGAQVAEDVLKALVAEHRALDPRGADLDAEQVEQVVGAERGHILERLALDLVRQEAGARLADRTATAGEPDAVDDAVLHAEHERDPVATERVAALVRRVGILDHPEVMGPPVVL